MLSALVVSVNQLSQHHPCLCFLFRESSEANLSNTLARNITDATTRWPRHSNNSTNTAMNDQDRYMAKELSGNVTASHARCVTNLSTGTSCETINFTAEALGNNFHAQECLPADTTTVGQDDQHFMFNPLPYTNEHGILSSPLCTPELNALGAWQPWPSSSLVSLLGHPDVALAPASRKRRLIWG